MLQVSVTLISNDVVFIPITLMIYYSAPMVYIYILSGCNKDLPQGY